MMQSERISKRAGQAVEWLGILLKATVICFGFFVFVTIFFTDLETEHVIDVYFPCGRECVTGEDGPGAPELVRRHYLACTYFRLPEGYQTRYYWLDEWSVYADDSIPREVVLAPDKPGHDLRWFEGDIDSEQLCPEEPDRTYVTPEHWHEILS